ncbi:glycerophosphodiester phosphodiesterase family protein [Lentibacter sp. XHP0401]|uniref:glycerophosphodiester phosphodiesterase family protein n=1 Tax=Lentibacter sp. XHP0401 TaxID=2984334 RepID=UPI0021E7584D|nr:glycerophosphodiester phosphodiesterase family protein [Lentibacter sp. XHP0401]MCV2894796.1 glycerophosphodiester phosphodiesterase family protein [Lentibacter sp. XHP0401]
MNFNEISPSRLRPTHIAALLSVILAILLILPTEPDEYDVPPPTALSTSREMILISHAGAGLPEGAYSNSLEALTRGYDHGLSMFEVDVHLTSDGSPVLLHDWGPGLRKWYRLSPIAWINSYRNDGEPFLTKKDFNALTMRHGLTALDLDGLAAWMKTHPNTLVNLNVKKETQRILTDFAASYPNLKYRVIVEVYDLETFSEIKAIGYDKLLWVADHYDDASVLAALKSLDFYAITFAANSQTLDRAELLENIDIPLWIYTINSASIAVKLADAGVDGIYTDSLIYMQSSDVN